MPVQDGGSTLHAITGVIGASVSGIFLWILGLVNLIALLGILRVARDRRSGGYDEAELERRLDQRGLVNRMLGGMTRSMGSSRCSSSAGSRRSPSGDSAESSNVGVGRFPRSIPRAMSPMRLPCGGRHLRYDVT